jgi:hypothetical protein
MEQLLVHQCDISLSNDPTEPMLSIVKQACDLVIATLRGQTANSPFVPPPESSWA